MTLNRLKSIAFGQLAICYDRRLRIQHPIFSADSRASAVLKRLALVSLQVTLLVLTACGPGTGGTGTGPQIATIFSFSSSAVPTEPPLVTVPGALDVVPPALATPPVLPGSTTNTASPIEPLAPSGAAPAPGACLANCTNANPTLLIDAGQVRLQTRCARFVSSSPLVVATSGDTTLAGSLETQKNNNGTIVTSSAPAVLVLQFSAGKADSERVTVRLLNNAGGALLSPFTLYRDAAAPIAASSAVTVACI